MSDDDRAEPATEPSKRSDGDKPANIFAGLDFSAKELPKGLPAVLAPLPPVFTPKPPLPAPLAPTPPPPTPSELPATQEWTQDTPLATKDFHIEVWLNDNAATAALGAEAKWRQAFTCDLRTESERDAADDIFGICNSYPNDMHCLLSYRELVVAYRQNKNRSLAIGDKIVVNGKELWCDTFGFSESPVFISKNRITL